MTEPLSPAAQAVIKKVQATLPDYVISDRTAGFFAAAALRAAVNQTNPKLHIEDINYQHQLYVDGWKDALDMILVIAAELTAPTLFERALGGDKDAACQFLREAGFTDEFGQLRPPYRSEDLNDD